MNHNRPRPRARPENEKLKNLRTSSHENSEKGSLERKMLGFRVLGNQDLEPCSWLKGLRSEENS